MTLAARPDLRSVTFRPDATIDVDAYPIDIPAVRRDLDRIAWQRDVTFLVERLVPARRARCCAAAEPTARGTVRDRQPRAPILLSYPKAKIRLFDATGVTGVRYEDTEHDAITRDFLNHDPRRLEQWFADDE